MAGRANDDGGGANVEPPVTRQRPSVRPSVGGSARSRAAPLRPDPRVNLAGRSMVSWSRNANRIHQPRTDEEWRRVACASGVPMHRVVWTNQEALPG
ncbi:uncharacterized protein LOC109610930 isoform X2 [Ooceraea biroi]|uniref:uncharacterized protein LOC109610930 isoform X2 n=1 Tax=Ooceraea biroi TaxID=2015173 RepID=UPI00097172F8|nr:uncharacterized protein LOC109610930 isoform X2 [Ooceraea biroi]